MPPWAIPVGLVVAALVYRVICTASGHTDLFGPLSWLPNHLDLVGIGLAVALVDASIDRQRLRDAGFGSAASPSRSSRSLSPRSRSGCRSRR